MKHLSHKSKYSIVFSKWSRKNYAIFASLHKVIKIARLSVDVCMSSLSKNKSIQQKSYQIKASEFEGYEIFESEEGLSEWINELLLKLGLLKVEESYGVDSHCYQQVTYFCPFTA